LNKYLYSISQNKKRLLVLTKGDLADPLITQSWKDYFLKEGHMVLVGNLNEKKTVESIIEGIKAMGSAKHERDIRRGMKPRPIKTMIIGIPNVGKSTLINKLAHRKAASVQNTPGHTKSQQWIKVDNIFELLDTPGVLPPHYEEKTDAINLALIGSIKQDILPIRDLVDYLLDFLLNYYPQQFRSLYNIDSNVNEHEEVLKAIATRRGLLNKSEYDVEKAEVLLLKEFKDGTITRATLERMG
ncbi:MAG: ribosome biogenesis GTPase YlqF, partial [Bacilli bacterium]|nr:ribosome biogenesis GTPase YlqF [Bacilli bacterium]